MPGVIKLRPTVVNVLVKPTAKKKNVPRKRANKMRRVPEQLVRTNQPKGLT